MAKKWERSEAILAQRISISQIGGFPSKKVLVRDEESAILEEDNKTLHVFEEGKHKVSGMMSSSEKNVVFIDRSVKQVRREVKDLWTGDDKKISAAIELKFKVTDPDKIRKLMLGRKDVATLEDVWTELRKEVEKSSLAPVVKKKKIDKLQSDRKTEKEIQVSAEVELKKKLEVFGLELLSLSVEFILPGEYEGYLKKRGVFKESVETEKMVEDKEKMKAVHEREVGEISGKVETREGVMDEMERERIRRETEKEIEEEETQQDMRDAMEGLKLKEIKDKQKMVEDYERKKMGLDSIKEALPGTDVKSLERKYNEIQELMGETEKKFFNRRIDRETYRKAMVDYEPEKTELEVKLKGGRKK